MSDKTGIEWTDATWNPIRGCSRVSEGCRNCYAEKTAHRFNGPGQPYEGLTSIVNGKPVWTGKIAFVESHLLDPLRWKAGRRIFVNSMSDLFHENVTDEMLDRIFAVMALCPQHTFQVLTKRPERMLAYLTQGDREARVAKRCVREGQPVAPGYFSMAPGGGDLWEIFGKPGRLRFVDERVNGGVPCRHTEWCAADFDKWPLPNVQLGVSVENQKAADERIPLLLQTPAAVRFLSCEPLLGAVSLEELPSHSGIGRYLDALSNFVDKHADVSARLDWVIVGGESGPGARPMHPDWARSLRDQCVAAGVPFFFKQWGEWAPVVDNATLADAWISPYGKPRGDLLLRGDACLRRVGKKAAGALLDGREWREFPLRLKVETLGYLEEKSEATA